MQALAKPKKKKYIWLTLTGLLPLVLCLIFAFIEARKTVIHQQTLTASMLLAQADNVSDLAWKMTDLLQQFRPRECSDIRLQLQQFGTLYPYFRSVGLTRGNEIYCSSAFGTTRGTLETMVRGALPVGSAPSWSWSVAGTFGVKDRPAVVFIRETDPTFGTYAVIDGQYLIDFMTAVGLKRGYHITMQFGGGYRISSGKPLYIYQGVLGTSSYTSQSSRYPITINITAPVLKHCKAGGR